MSNVSQVGQEPMAASPTTATVIWRNLKRNPVVIVGLVVVLAWFILALLAPVIAPTDPLAQNVSNRLQPPNENARMGTDELGRDIFTRVLYGGRITIPAALFAF